MADYRKFLSVAGATILLQDMVTLESFRPIEGNIHYASFLIRVAEGATVEEVTIENPTPYGIYHVASKIFDGIRAVTSPTWEELGGAVANPNFFCSKLLMGFVRTVFAYQITGGAAEIKLVETHAGVSRDLVAAPVVLPDTDGAPTDFYFDSSVVLSIGDNIYSVHARVTTATQVDLKYMNSAVMELVVPA